MLTLSEKLLLLALNDEKGSVVFSASTALPYGLAGAILLELYLKDFISFRDDKVKVESRNDTGNEILDDALSLIIENNKLHDAKYWVQKLYSKISDLQERIANNLVSKKILTKEKHSFMWIINYNRYPTHDLNPENNVRESIKSIVLKRADANEEDLALISLVQACELTNEIFDKSDRKRAKKRMKDIINNRQVSSAIAKTVEEINAAILTVIIASSVTTTVITS